MHLLRSVIIIFSLTITTTWGMAQPPIDWYFQDPETSPYYGIALNKLETTLAGKSPKQNVVVAIIDTGIDDSHEDLQGQIWVNKDEIAGNALDDDQNGYIDDIHGWNFLGSAQGENVINETLEVTRLYAKYQDYFADKITGELSRKDKALYDQYQEYKRIVEKARKKSQAALNEIEGTESLVVSALDVFKKKYPNQKLDKRFLKSFEPGDVMELQIAAQIFEQAAQMGFELTTLEELRTEVVNSFSEAKSQYVADLEYTYNPDFDSRAIIGDNYDDSSERYYGNNETAGDFAFHGTHVSGIVAARADNDLGSRGVAQHVKLMSLRVVPNGDEHDKDVANAIFYAVDNGASVINMSFGKGYSWDKSIVDKAVRYARKHDVLLVHAAGNSSENNDEVLHYPVAKYEKSGLFRKKRADNWVTVGSMSPVKGEEAVSSFSHYGPKTVDVFAPGDYMFSCAPGNDYSIASGTSASAPVVTGIAAVLRGYFPALTAQQIRQILIDSVTPVEGKVYRPGTEEFVNFSELCVSGGAVNAYKAFQLASRTRGKKKIKSIPQVEGLRA